MNLMDKLEEIVAKIKADKTLIRRFDKEPVAVLEEILGIDLPDEQVEQVIKAVKAKLTVDNLGAALNGLGNLFGKKD